jgi:hypothetical protein
VVADMKWLIAWIPVWIAAAFGGLWLGSMIEILPARAASESHYQIEVASTFGATFVIRLDTVTAEIGWYELSDLPRRTMK